MLPPSAKQHTPLNTFQEFGLATAAISAAALIVGLSKLGLDAGLVRYLPESKNRNGQYSTIILSE